MAMTEAEHESSESTLVIEHPRRLLIVGGPECDLSGLVANLTGSLPARGPEESIAGSIHEWILKTNYYTANIPVWIDEIPNLEQWQAEFLKPEAREVIQAIGGFIFCFNKPSASNENAPAKLRTDVEAGMKAIEAIVDKACGYEWEGAKLAVLMSLSGSHAKPMRLVREDWEDLCMEHGFEFVDADATGKNEFGEAQGLERIKESVATNDWNALADGEDVEDYLGSLDDEQAQMNAELWGLKTSLLAAEDHDAEPLDEDHEIDNLETMIRQAMAIKEQGAELPLEERRRFAARAIDDLMKSV